MKKFQVNQIYLHPSLYGSSFYVQVVSRDEDTITVIEIDFPEEKTTYVIEHDEEGNEVILIWNYKGEKDI